ncbi:ABC transporter permease [Xylanibacillus composti]|uniref:Permease n=1 Tax=Xylanibacillus composti TaxID=1572762 RepID=A0A8J4H1V2_9BACL|nr:ABC transporter permease [Xylanibacillus composti]MDT9726823.1 ABC transporter permease [Xylanibacillus composti]GIQ67193.1 permease [Xylanibacillus composti]
MKLLRQLTLRNLKQNRSRTLVTLVGIILSAAMICGVATLFASFQDLLIRHTQQANGHFHVKFPGVSADKVAYITDHAETKIAMRTMELGFALWPDSKQINKPYLAISAFDKSALEHLPVQLKEGRLPETGHELVISEELQNNTEGELRVGDTLNLAIGTRTDHGFTLSNHNAWSETEVFDAQQMSTYTVTGIMKRPGFEDWHAPGYSAVAYLDEAILADAEQLDIYVQTRHPKQIFQTAPKIAEQIGTETFEYHTELLRWMGLSKNDRVNMLFLTTGLIIILLIVVGSITVIYNAFAISVSERKKQFGMLASVGATNRQIRNMVFFEGLFLGLIAIPIGILSGIGGIAVTLYSINQLMDGNFFNLGLGLRVAVPPSTILITVFFVAITIFLSAYIPAKRASRISPVEAIRLQTDIQITGKKLKTSKLTRRLFGMEGELALKNLRRNHRRYRATVFSLFISIVLFVSFSSFINYAFEGSDLYYADLSYDLYVEKSEAPLPDVLDFYEQLAAQEEVGQHAIVRSLYMNVDGLELADLGPYLRKLLSASSSDSEQEWYKDVMKDGQGNYRLQAQVSTIKNEMFATYVEKLGLQLDAFTDVNEPRGILINMNKTDVGAFAAYSPLAMEAGDHLILKEYAYDEQTESLHFPIEIGSMTEELPFGLAYTNVTGFHLVVSDQIFDLIVSKGNEYTQAEGNRAQFLVGLKDKAAHKVFEDRIEAIDAAHPSSGPTYIWNLTRSKEETQQTKTVISIFLYGFISLITLIGVTNILNTIHTNIALRRREFAMLKSVGLTPAGFNRMIRYESVFYGTKALLYGLPVSIVVSWLLHRSFGNTFDFAFRLPWQEIGICIVSVFVLVFFTMTNASRKLKRENIIDALKMDS